MHDYEITDIIVFAMNETA